MIRNSFLWPLFILDFILHFSRALTFTFFPIYLSHTLGFNPLLTGYALGGSLVTATLVGVYCGILIDRFTPLRSLLLAIVVSVLVYSVLPASRQFAQVFLLLVIIEVAFTTMHLSVKSLLTGLLPSGQRGAAYSISYTLINIAFCSAPILGITLSHFAIRAPMWLSGALSVVSLLILLAVYRRYRAHLRITRPQSGQKTGLRQTFKVLASDNRLQLFTLGGLFSALVYARFATYLSQYLGYVVSESEALRLITLIVSINAATVILLQYVIGKRITHKNMVFSVMIGSGLLVSGLLFYQVSELTIFWIIATVLFSLGEVIIVPSEFLFIDAIAREDMKGAYFGVQNISMLGGGANAILFGYLLDSHLARPAAIFYFLMVFAVLGCALYLIGIRQKRAVAVVDES
ncbi:MFS transporter [Rouxiella badensis]|jgi:predicted MFS family arabinose efflux permease|uniref:MFS transporter n=1 Tax=Rouxiella badensis TaxID=1646377 RepID=A0A1X0WC46_9GAMM|nr:MFS transporter [Rouxiella badensis]MCC3701628.1 MFS transporter [Rouxiella badensis]ORJ24339.1 MFS transporter [Rouxiella badensis]QII38824.1 MFS transporter [Rouxiella badensis]QOI54652.1 MFS transporter [Rouxiella badensis subsp. acadiensis]WAT10788.1 MFS transporter [Rouxiella badensis]